MYGIQALMDYFAKHCVIVTSIMKYIYGNHKISLYIEVY